MPTTGLASCDMMQHFFPRKGAVLLPSFAGAHVLVVGDLMLDRYWHGDSWRLSPEAPVPVVSVRGGDERPGGAGNVALNIAGLGARVSLVGLVGDDESGKAICERLNNAGVSCRVDRVPGTATIAKLRVLSRHQQLIRLDLEQGFQISDTAVVECGLLEALPDADVVLFSDYAKGTLRDIARWIPLVRDAGKPVLVDPKGRDFSRYRGATVLTPNQAELEAVVGPCESDEALVQRADDLRRELSLEALLVTRGDRGMTLLASGHAALHLPAHAREVYDVTGAGDTVVAALAAALACGQDLARAAHLANVAAGIVVGKLGAAQVTPEEIRIALTEISPPVRGVVDEEVLMTAVAAARERDETLVMTNGCFDLLHAGHVRYLEQARKFGDRLIVAVNDDASVRRLKGENRPINSVAQRMEVLAALSSVDWVVPFAEDTPERLICRVAPDILVKGGDYRPDAIAGARCVQGSGGRVAVLDWVPGCSTTGLISAIRKS
jgi:D-beta-D-heptose 7-phosphate kinase / D-beta-D-heptose 1-phosphate adenosyltransferase